MSTSCAEVDTALGRETTSEAQDLGAIALHRQIHGRADVMRRGPHRHPQPPAALRLDEAVEGSVLRVDRQPFPVLGVELGFTLLVELRLPDAS